MGAPLVRSVWAGASSSLRRSVAAYTRIQASPFASSSRVGLDFSAPRFADPEPEAAPAPSPAFATTTTTTTTTLLDAPAPAPAPEPASTGDSTAEDAEAATSGEASSGEASSGEELKRIPRFNIAASRAASSQASSRANRLIPALPSTMQSGRRYAPESDPFANALAVTHTLHVRSHRNNCLLAFTDAIGSVVGTISGGNGKVFKGQHTASYEATTQASLKMFDRIRDFLADGARVRLRLSFNGLHGLGREAFTAALMAPEANDLRQLIVRVEDRTRIKIGGTRARKKRRI